MDKLQEDFEHILTQTHDLWESISGKTIFVTGGTGFFGVWLQMSFVFINRKLNLNARMIILTRNKNIFFDKYPFLANNPEVSFVEGNICSFQFFDDSVDFIIHAATDTSVQLNHESPITMFHTIVDGTKRVLDFAVEKNVTSFLFTSSGAVYGANPSVFTNIKEDFVGAPAPSEPQSVYGEGKRMAEVLCAIYHHHFHVPIKIARGFAFVGPYLTLDTHFAVGNFIQDTLYNRNILIKGDGNAIRSYLYVADLIIWLWTILIKGKDNRPYNVGSDFGVTISELAKIVCFAGLSPNTEINILSSNIKGSAPNQYVPNIERAKTELGLQVHIDLPLAIKKTIQFYR